MSERRKIIHLSGMLVILMTLWLLLSGHYTPLLLSLGVFSVLLVMFISDRMQLIKQDEPEALSQFLKWIPYLFWLLIEIIKSNIDVCKRILDPKLPIRPEIVWLNSSQRGELARVAYANSITLTPGTISIDVVDDKIEVHALSKNGVDGLNEGEMDRRVSKDELVK